MPLVSVSIKAGKLNALTKAERSCLQYYTRRGYRVVRGRLILLASLRPKRFFERLSTAQKFYPDFVYAYFFRELHRAHRESWRFDPARRQALAALWKSWPNRSSDAGIPDFFVYSASDPEDHFFVEAKGPNDRIRVSQQKTGNHIAAKGVQVFIYRLTRSGRRIIYPLSPGVPKWVR